MTAVLGCTRDLFVGLDYEVPLLDGAARRYVNLDNAATTPPFRSVLTQLSDSARWYSSADAGWAHVSSRRMPAAFTCRGQQHHLR